MLKKVLLLFFIVFVFVGCAKKTEDASLPKMMEEINNVLIVMEDELWLGALGDSIRNYLAKEIPGVRPPEPLFTLNHLSPNMFHGDVKKFRNILLFEIKSNASHFRYLPNKNSVDQIYYDIEGSSEDILMEYFLKHALEISNKIYYSEIRLMQKQLGSKNQHSSHLLFDRFDVKMNVPTTYEVKVQEDDFMWFKKERASGSIGLLVYSIGKDKVLINDSVSMKRVYDVRDSISGRYIHSIEENSYMEMIDVFRALKVNKHINGIPIMESFGSWDMINSFMGGPTLTYIYTDTLRDRYLFIDGMIYNPSMRKRAMLLEIRAIIETLQK